MITSFQTNSARACGHISIPYCPGWRYQTWSTDQVVSTSFCLLCSFSWGHLSIQQRWFVLWPGVKLGGVICKGQVLQESICFHINVNLAQQPKAWKMKQYLGWWHKQWLATMILPTLTSQKQQSYKHQSFENNQKTWHLVNIESYKRSEGYWGCK